MSNRKKLAVTLTLGIPLAMAGLSSNSHAKELDSPTGKNAVSFPERNSIVCTWL